MRYTGMKRAAFGVLGVIVGVIAWRVVPDIKSNAETRAAGAASTAAPLRTAERSGPSAGRERSDSTSADLASLEARPFVDIRSELERRAAAGDGHAAFRLGSTLASCAGYRPTNEADMENALVNAVAHGVVMHDGERGLSPEEALTRLKLQVAQRARDCENAAGVSDRNAIASAFAWIERGAALGDADAQALYGSLAFSNYQNARDALADADNVRERKRIALDYLDRSLAQGDALALLRMSIHHARGDLYPQSATSAYTYLYAYSLTARASDFVPGMIDLMLATAAQPLSAQALESAREDAVQIAACCDMVERAAP